MFWCKHCRWYHCLRLTRLHMHHFCLSIGYPSFVRFDYYQFIRMFTADCLGYSTGISLQHKRIVTITFANDTFVGVSNFERTVSSTIDSTYYLNPMRHRQDYYCSTPNVQHPTLAFLLWYRLVSFVHLVDLMATHSMQWRQFVIAWKYDGNGNLYYTATSSCGSS